MANRVVTPTELEQVNQLKDELKDLIFKPAHFGNGQAFFIRWLRENKHNTKETAEAIRKYMKHREEYDLDNVEKFDPPSLIKEQLIYQFCGYTKTGSPVSFAPWGKCDVKKIVDNGLGEELLKSMFQIFEVTSQKAVEQVKEIEPLSPGPPGITFLVDLSNIEIMKMISKSALNLLIEEIKFLNAYYVVSVDYFYICNAPFTFSMLWKLVKPFVKEELANKLVFVPNATFLHQALHKEGISMDLIPTQLGGNLKLFDRKV